jgi:hypothetical protein
MVTKDPRQSLDTILEYLIGVNDARAGAVFGVEGGPTLTLGRGIAQDALDWALACWSGDEASLRDGRLSKSDSRFLLPVLRRERLVALVYLEADHVDLETVADVSSLIGDVTQQSGRQPDSLSPVESYLEHTPASEIERRKLLILLDRHEWNVARVARELKVTRTTVYKRLEAFAIPRKKVPKAGRRLRTDGVA